MITSYKRVKSNYVYTAAMQGARDVITYDIAKLPPRK